MLGTQIDLVLIHSPGFGSGPPPQGQPAGCWGFSPCCDGPQQLQSTYRGLELALQQNLTRAIGVSNFQTNHLEVRCYAVQKCVC